MTPEDIEQIRQVAKVPWVVISPREWANLLAYVDAEPIRIAAAVAAEREACAQLIEPTHDFCLHDDCKGKRQAAAAIRMRK